MRFGKALMLVICGTLPLRPVLGAGGHHLETARPPGIESDGECPTSVPAVKAGIARTSLAFFLENTDPRTGLVRVVADNFGPTEGEERQRRTSIAATGFGLAVVASAARQGLVSRPFAAQYCTRALQFAATHHAELTRRGWFFHYLDGHTGERWGQSEYSTIDTALFLAGAITCRQVFPDEPPIAELADRLYGAVDFRDMMTDGGALPESRTLSLSYRPEAGPGGKPAGYSPHRWDHYAEHMLLLVLGLGSPSPAHRLPPEAWTAWKRQSTKTSSADPRLAGKDIVGNDRALFTHQYSQLFLDFRKFRDAFGIDYFENSRLAALANREASLGDRSSRTFRAGFWGLSAGDAPKPDGSVGYQVSTPLRRNGIACTGCVPGSAAFLPDETLSDVVSWCRSPQAGRLWGKYGLADSVSLDRGGPEGWISPTAHAITVGPEFLSLANLDGSHSVWSDFMTSPDIRRGMERAASAPLTPPVQEGGTP